MSAEPASTTFSVNFQGPIVRSQVATGQHITLTQRLGPEADELIELFARLKTEVATGAPADLRNEATEQADALAQAVIAEQPDPGTIRRVLRWFKQHAPEVAGAVVSVVVNPLVGKAVEGAGTAIADRFREVVEQEIGH